MIDCSKTENFLKEIHRMCASSTCHNCPLSVRNETELDCDDYREFYPKETIEVVQKWSDEHPYRTMLSELIKLLPNLPLQSNGAPYICPRYVGWDDFPPSKCKASKRGDCVACWNRPYEENHD